MRLLVDTNVIIDALIDRNENHEDACCLLMLGKVREFELWASASQWTDMFYILSEGGKRSRAHAVKRVMKGIRKAARVAPLMEGDIDDALAGTWDDFEDACVHQAALSAKVDAIITENGRDFEKSSIPVYGCRALFDYLRDERGLTYAVMDSN